MSDISKNDAVDFANAILQLQKRKIECEKTLASLETWKANILRIIDKLQAAMIELAQAAAQATIPPELVKP